MRKNNYLFVLFATFIISAFCVSVIQTNQQSQTLQTSGSVEVLSNKKIGWGIKRAPNHEQPDLGSENKRLIERYNGIAMGNKVDKYVYLTFDNGYEAGYTPKILEVLKANNVKACFFITGHYLNTNTDLVKQMVEDGHQIGNHTSRHKEMPNLTDEQMKEEITTLHTAVFEKTGYEMKYLRPPKGEYSQRCLSVIQSLGYTTTMWSLAYDDWDEQKQDRTDYGKQKIIDNIHNGAVILLHGTSKDNANILDYCIKEIRKMGYEFKSLDEFVK